jgi:DNA-binding MarR family transcriptional regulator
VSEGLVRPDQRWLTARPADAYHSTLVILTMSRFQLEIYCSRFPSIAEMGSPTDKIGGMNRQDRIPELFRSLTILGSIDPSLSARTWSVFLWIGRLGESTQQDMEQLLGYPQSDISRWAIRFERLGLIERRRRAKDSMRIKVSEAGGELLNRLR